MTKVDQFESIFRAADKEPFVHARPPLRSVLLVTDLEAYDAELLDGRTRSFLGALGDDDVAWTTVTGDRYRTVQELLDLVEAARPDLICTYRHLHTEGWRYAMTLGDHAEVLTQVTETPVLLLPHPRRMTEDGVQLGTASTVVAVTDHLAGDHRLVNWATRLTMRDGTLILAHIEDQAIFDRYLGAISRIPDLETELARRTLRDRLLLEPRDYAASCAAVLERVGVSVDVEVEVRFGHSLHDYLAIVTSRRADLLVVNTKDADQLAMHGLAYPIAVELTTTPLLML